MPAQRNAVAGKGILGDMRRSLDPHRDVASSTIHQGSGDLLCRASQLARGAF